MHIRPQKFTTNEVQSEKSLSEIPSEEVSRQPFTDEKPTSDAVESAMRFVFLALMLIPPICGILLLLQAREQLRDFLRETPLLVSDRDIEKLKALARRQMYLSLFQACVLGLPVAAFGGGILLHVLFPSDFVWILLPSILVILAALRMRPEEQRLWCLPAENSRLEEERDRIISCWRFRALPDF